MSFFTDTLKAERAARADVQPQIAESRCENPASVETAQLQVSGTRDLGGRPRVYASPAAKQKAYRERKAAQ